MALLDVSRSTLLVIDLQGKLVHMVHRPNMVLEATRRLIRIAGMFAVPVVLTEQYPKGIGPTDPIIQEAFEALTTPRHLLEKTAFSCWGDLAFEPLLRSLAPDLPPARRQIVVAGIETQVCVVQTVVELLEAGYEVHVCWDAVSGRGEEHRQHALERMAAAGAILTNHESVAFEWARDKNHPNFKAISALMKEGQPQG